MEDKLASYLERFEEAAVNLGPQALDLALEVIRIQSLSSVIVGVFLLVITAIIVFFGVRSAQIASIEEEKNILDQDTDRKINHGTLAIVCLFASAFFGTISGYLLLNMWNWVGTFAPHIRLARDVMERL